jgi:hypothetical protein
MQAPSCKSVPATEMSGMQALHEYSVNGYASYRFETTDDCRQFALKADRIGLRGSISRQIPITHDLPPCFGRTNQ